MVGLEDMVKRKAHTTPRLESYASSGQLLVMADQHFPHVSDRMQNITLAYTKQNAKHIGAFVFLGDSVDNPKMSEFPQRADNNSILQDEIDQFTKHVYQYHKLAPKAEIYILAGNHCVGRFERVKGLNPNLSSLRMLTFDGALRESIKEQGLEYSFNFGNYFKINNTVFTHGDPRIDPRLKGGANGPRRTADTYPDYDCDVVMGHKHQVIQEPRPKSHFAVQTSSVYVVGAMFDITKVEKHYTSFNAYQNGFMVVHQNKGYKQIDNLEIKPNTPLLYNGVKYS